MSDQSGKFTCKIQMLSSFLSCSFLLFFYKKLSFFYGVAKDICIITFIISQSPIKSEVFYYLFLSVKAEKCYTIVVVKFFCNICG